MRRYVEFLQKMDMFKLWSKVRTCHINAKLEMISLKIELMRVATEFRASVYEESVCLIFLENHPDQV